MEFFIKKNATLPLLKFEIFQDGRSNYNHIKNLSGITSGYVTLLDVNTNQVKFASRPCVITTGVSEYDESKILYFVEYQFKNTETKNLGRFEVELSIIDSYGTIILPLESKVYVNIIESFSVDGFSFINNYEVDYPCCVPEKPNPTPPITPSNTVTPTASSVTPTVTPTNTITPTVTPSSESPTPTPTVTSTPTLTKTPTKTPTPTVTPTITLTPTTTSTPTITPTNSNTPAVSPTITPTNSITPTITNSPTNTPTITNSPTNTPTITTTPTITPSSVPPSVIVEFKNSSVNNFVQYDITTNTYTNLPPYGGTNFTLTLAKKIENNVTTRYYYDGYYKIYYNTNISDVPNYIDMGYQINRSFAPIESDYIVIVKNLYPNPNWVMKRYTPTGTGQLFGKLPAQRITSGGILKTTTNRIIVITTNISGGNPILSQYNLSTITNPLAVMTPEVEINLTNLIDGNDPAGIMVANGEFYIGAGSSIYHISKTPPYTVSQYYQNIGTPIGGFAQNYTEWNIHFSV